MPVVCLESLESLVWIWSFRPGLVDFETPSNRSLGFVWSSQLPMKRFELGVLDLFFFVICMKTLSLLGLRKWICFDLLGRKKMVQTCLSVLLSADVWSAKSYPFNVELCLESVTPKCFQAEFLDELSKSFLEDVWNESEYSDGDLSSHLFPWNSPWEH